MIEHKDSLSISEASEYIKNKEIKAFAKDFTKIKGNKANELRKNLQELNIIKLNQKHISKIIDFLPTDKEDLNKVLMDINLDENETTKILETVKGIN